LNRLADRLHYLNSSGDKLREQQTKKEMVAAEEVLPRVARKCYKWLLCPVKNGPTDRQHMIEAFPLNTSGLVFNAEIERVCRENEIV
jgi:predicted AAA+ superfamily ATPase